AAEVACPGAPSERALVARRRAPGADHHAGLLSGAPRAVRGARLAAHPARLAPQRDRGDVRGQARSVRSPRPAVGAARRAHDGSLTAAILGPARAQARTRVALSAVIAGGRLPR